MEKFLWLENYPPSTPNSQELILVYIDCYEFGIHGSGGKRAPSLEDQTNVLSVMRLALKQTAPWDWVRNLLEKGGIDFREAEHATSHLITHEENLWAMLANLCEQDT